MMSENQRRQPALDLPGGPGDPSLEQKRENKEVGGGDPDSSASKNLAVGLKGANRENGLR